MGAVSRAQRGLTLGLVYAFTTVATQAVVRTERAGEAAGITLTVLVSLAGVGIAVTLTVLEMLQHNEIPRRVQSTPYLPCSGCYS
ncbi:hypothetical protein AAHH99_11595 [Mycobacterium neumannii]